jgi:pilus assembly protein Flp/PilA
VRLQQQEEVKSMQKIREKVRDVYAGVIRGAVVRETGQGMVEYALILFLVSIAAILVLKAVGANVTGVFGQIRDALPGAGT